VKFPTYFREVPALLYCVFLAYCRRSRRGPRSRPIRLRHSHAKFRYHFREHFGHAKPGEKTVSAPAFKREGLPKLRVADLNGVPERIVEGRVEHCRISFGKDQPNKWRQRSRNTGMNVLDSSGKPLAGFAQVIPNPLTKGGDISRKEFEMPIDQALKEKIEKSLLAKEQFITHVNLIVGMDDDFLSQDFPK
jgi:hypothetical protein